MEPAIPLSEQPVGRRTRGIPCVSSSRLFSGSGLSCCSCRQRMWNRSGRPRRKMSSKQCRLTMFRPSEKPFARSAPHTRKHAKQVRGACRHLHGRFGRRRRHRPFHSQRSRPRPGCLYNRSTIALTCRDFACFVRPTCLYPSKDRSVAVRQSKQ